MTQGGHLQTARIIMMDVIAEEIAVVDDNRNIKNQAFDKKKILGIRIGVIFIILLVITGIFIFKALSDKDKINNDSASGNNTVTRETIPLKISKVDLDKIKSYKIPFVIDFGSDQCIPCKQMAPVLETLNKEWQGKAIVQFVDV